MPMLYKNKTNGRRATYSPAGRRPPHTCCSLLRCLLSTAFRPSGRIRSADRRTASPTRPAPQQTQLLTEHAAMSSQAKLYLKNTTEESLKSWLQFQWLGPILLAQFGKLNRHRLGLGNTSSASSEQSPCIVRRPAGVLHKRRPEA